MTPSDHVTLRVGDRVISGRYEGVIREVNASGVTGMHVVRFPGGDALRPTDELRKVPGCAVCGAPRLLPDGSTICGLCKDETPPRHIAVRLFEPVATMRGQTTMELP